MHNLNNTTELVIRKLTEGYIELTQGDRDAIYSYISSNQDKIPTISRLRNYCTDSHLGAMYAFLYNKSGIADLLEIISDKGKQESVKEKADQYKYFYRG